MPAVLFQAVLQERSSFRTDYQYAICGNYVVGYKIGEAYVEIYRVVNQHGLFYNRFMKRDRRRGLTWIFN